MRTLLLALLAGMIGLSASVSASAQDSSALSLIPAPVSQEVNQGHFTLPSTILVEAPSQPELGHTLDDLKTRLGRSTGYTVTLSHDANPAATIRLILNKTAAPNLGDEGYTLT